MDTGKFKTPLKINQKLHNSSTNSNIIKVNAMNGDRLHLIKNNK